MKLYVCHPSLHAHYKHFIVTTMASVIPDNIDTISLMDIVHLCRSLCSFQGLPEFLNRAWKRFVPAKLRLPYSQYHK